MKYYLFFLIVILCIGCEMQQKKDKPAHMSKYEAYSQARERFSQAVQGNPLVVPLIEESDPSLILMPVSNDTSNFKVDRLYLVDTTREKFDYARDIYNIDSFERICISPEDSLFRTRAYVSNVHDKKYHMFSINGYMYKEILKIYNGKWDYPPATIIPINERVATEEEIREVFSRWVRDIEVNDQNN